MASWFKWGRETRVRVAQDPIRHVCRCGHTRELVRGKQHQRLSCSVCGEIGILLPRDAYPGTGPGLRKTATPQPDRTDDSFTPRTRRAAEPLARARAAADPGARAAKPPANTPTQPTPQQTPQPTPQPSPKSKSRPVRTQEAVIDSAAKRERVEPLVTRRGIQVESSYTPRRRRITPFRLVAVCMLLLVVVTGWWSVRQFQLSSDASQLGDLTRSGIESLESGDFTTAARDLGRAADVRDRLGRGDPAADLIRQRSREAGAADGLIAESLAEILANADQVHQSGGEAAWKREFDRDHRGRWIVMQSILEPPSEPVDDLDDLDDLDEPVDGDWEAEPGEFEAEYPFAVGDRPVRMIGRLPALARLAGWGDAGIEDPRPVIFAAQLETCHLDPATDTWRIELTRDTAFLWTDIGSMRHLGFLPDAILGEEGIADILDRQATAVGLEVDPVAADVSRVGSIETEATR